MLGALMFASKIAMEILPNVHLVGTFIVLCTVVFRVRALIPIYIFVFITGLYFGFPTWWLSYLYIWSVLWGMAMLIPKNISPKLATAVYPIVCALHGFLYGVLYAPTQSLLYGLDFEESVVWIVAGLPFDLIHSASNFAAGFLILPLAQVMKKLYKRSSYRQ